VALFIGNVKERVIKKGAGKEAEEVIIMRHVGGQITHTIFLESPQASASLTS
jgi:hypothetical protein